MLDKKDHSNIKYKRVNASTGKEVAWENIVKGYKVNENYVVLTDSDFEKASPEKTKIIEITEFVDEKEIDSIYFETPYYLQPEKAGVKAYALLRDALKKTGKAGLGTYVLRNRENLVLIKPHEDILILNKIRFPEEIRNPEEIKPPAANNKTTELKMAVQLIEQLSSEFDIEKYKDTYSKKLMKLIKAKAKGKPIKRSPLRVVHSSSRDLVSQLKAILRSSKRKAS
jgi:DNA end-binding protein Ku